MRAFQTVSMRTSENSVMGTSENTPLAELAEIPALSTEFQKKFSELYVLLACDSLL